MRIYIFTLSVILAFTFSAFGQTKLPKYVEVKYDKFKDKTTAGYSDYVSNVSLILEFDYPGKELSVDQREFYLYFIGGTFQCEGFCFHDGDALILLIDGERVTAGTFDGLSDTAMFTLDRAMIQQIVTAKLVEYQVSRFEGKWERKTLDKFKAVLDLGTVKTK